MAAPSGEFVWGVMLAPSLLTFLWMCIFGGNALFMELHGAGGIVEAVNQDYSLGLFKTLEQLFAPALTWSVAALTTFLLISWFMTSSDSGTLVICTMLSMGRCPSAPAVPHLLGAGRRLRGRGAAARRRSAGAAIGVVAAGRAACR